ncbi:hypothetical protein PGTUg99_032093 [Puccinia graminis f. sp. tritici]|uniref:Uncharacterized protein n=1 Tax=Puccinia graminis f. sp. tritici TaxID=56615 RepID=A0A5B0LWQ9_PUCGR|nr:hypothetical protein PGTUg99_032093 [Puccinia graminis f. sp. tritici]
MVLDYNIAFDLRFLTRVNWETASTFSEFALANHDDDSFDLLAKLARLNNITTGRDDELELRPTVKQTAGDKPMFELLNQHLGVLNMTNPLEMTHVDWDNTRLT